MGENKYYCMCLYNVLALTIVLLSPINMTVKIGGGKKKRECWLPAFSGFPTRSSKGFFLQSVKSCHCVVKG